MINKSKQYRDLSRQYYKSLETSEGFTVFTQSMKPFRRPEYGDSWGDWIYMENDTLRLYRNIYPTDEDRVLYEIDLEKFDNKLDAMNWLVHLSYKTWCDMGILGQLVLAFTDIKNWVY